ncbi:MAG TPA: nickel pincer cofactor biosynthesis protein LarB [Spirochaetota bacterium]|mgnify:FL=1|nr:nickel pincer cofactor biosynthesis protein LarB [Spirochaetota bacterium]HPF05953.1 nickel pincer cofactor biosynthesis protein LarB [Spirochaetota bacterium]HPR37227.1 nickel pincer cofactor biosynthesis protein LarB [Spirochaetota bacterium]
MNEQKIKQLLADIKSGQISEDEALAKLKILPYEDLGFARVDHHRALRTGTPEVIFSQGKTFEQVREIAEKLHHNNRVILATRATGELYDYLLNSFDSITYNRHARIIIIGEIPEPVTDKYILVITGGTSDIPYAEEAALTAEAMGSPVKRLFDVGITGVHRVLSHIDLLTGANVIVAAAGMEGALPALAAGLVSRPVIALPTSVGYGANFQGLSALLTMINSCAPGVAVVNIDNGFGAGYLASIINAG